MTNDTATDMTTDMTDMTDMTSGRPDAGERS
jgi:hypothetical protein